MDVITTVSRSYPVACKPHRCDGCSGAIVRGDRYHRWTGIGDEWEGLATSKECESCCARYGRPVPEKRACEHCGGPLPAGAPGNRRFCSPRCNKRAWLERPGNRERDRADALAWKAAHRDEKRAQDIAYNAAHKGTCSRCDGPTGRQNNGGVCQSCRSADAEERVRLIVAMWARGALLREIADELGTSVNCLGVDMVRLRDRGHALPYRGPSRRAAA